MFEYKVVPAPRKGVKAKGIKTPEDRFSYALQELMNSEAQDGWEFVRAETLPSEERSGFRSTNLVYRSVFVFRKAILQGESAAPKAPSVRAPEPVTAPESQLEPEDSAETASYLDDDYESSSAKA